MQILNTELRASADLALHFSFLLLFYYYFFHIMFLRRLVIQSYHQMFSIFHQKCNYF